MPILCKYVGKKVAYFHVLCNHIVCFPSALFKPVIQTPKHGKEVILSYVIYRLWD